jgi:hypothetical protein
MVCQVPLSHFLGRRGGFTMHVRTTPLGDYALL